MAVNLGFGKKMSKKPRKGAIPQELVDKINAMTPQELTVELTREQLAVETLKKEMEEDQKIIDAKKLLETLENMIQTQNDVVEAKVLLEEKIQGHRDEEYDNAKLTLKAVKVEWTRDINNRKKIIKFMMKTVKHHVDSGALKFKP